MTKILTLAASLLAVAGPAQSPAGPVDTVDAFHAALAAGDAEAALAQLAAEVVIFEGGGAEMSREEYASHHLGADMQFAAAVEREVTDRREKVVGDLAYVLSRTRTTGAFRDREIDSVGVETILLQQRDGSWKITHIHWSSREAPEGG